MLQRLERGQAEGLRQGGHDVNVRAGVEAVELGGGQEAREEEALAQAARRDVLLHRAHAVARPRDDEPDVPALRGHARGGLDEVTGPLLRGDSAGKEHERIAALGFLVVDQRPRVDRVVHDAQALGRDRVAPREQIGRVRRDGHDPIGRREAQPLDRGHEAVLPAARAIELRRVHVEDERLAARAPGLDTREEGEPVVRVDHVEGFARGDPARGRGVAQHFLRKVGPVVGGRPPRTRRRAALLPFEGGRHVGPERRRDAPHAKGGSAPPAPPARHPLDLGGRDDPEVLDRGRGRAAGQDERHVRFELDQAAHEPLAGHAEPAADRGRELPAEHEDAHRGSS